MTEKSSKELQKRGPGRPSKADIQQAKTPGRVGRPPGTAAILKDYRARMLASPKSEKVLQKVLDTALEDGHPHQGVCMKLVAERLLPASYFQKDNSNAQRPQLEITINAEGGTVSMGSSSSSNIDDSDAIDGEFSEE